jgi:hypothetical protein
LIIWHKKPLPKQWVSIEEFEAKNSIYMRRSTYNKAKDYTKKIKNHVLVDANYVNSWNQDVIKIINSYHDIYYGLTYGYEIKEFHIAKYLAKKTKRNERVWVSFIQYQLFGELSEQHVLLYRLSEMVREFFYHASYMLYKLLKSREPVNNY